MSVEVPDSDELLRIVATAAYGDESPMEAGRGGALHLSAVLPAVSDAIGHPLVTPIHADPKALRERLGLPTVRSAVVVLVDGMGYWNLAMRAGHVPYLRGLLRESANQRPISTCAPSTTTAAMAVFGTGTCPGLTGMAGYTELDPATGRLVQLIGFKDPLVPKSESKQKQPPVLVPHDLQRVPTIFERLVDQDVRVTSSGLAKFADSPLTQAALRGPRYIANVTPGERVRAAAEAAREPGLTYLYIRDTDKTGHDHGWQSPQWIGAFERVDGQLAQLRRLVPRGTLIVIVADHGMVSADPAFRIDIAEEPALREGVRLVGGEPRAVMLYAEDGESADAIAARWRQRLGERALVRTRDQAIDDGLYGLVDERIRPMLGDVIVQAAGQVTLVDSRTQSDKATRLPAVHGSQTMLESDIPCLIDLA